MTPRCAARTGVQTHEPMLVHAGADVIRMFEPYNPPGCTVTVGKGEDPQSQAEYEHLGEAWADVSASGRVGVCKYCRLLVFFDLAQLHEYAHSMHPTESEKQ